MVLNPTLSKSKSVSRAYKLKFSPLTPSCSRSRSSDGHLQVGKPPECSGKIYLPPALPSSTDPGEPQPNSLLESFAVTKCWVISEASCLAAEDEKREMEELRKSSLLLFEQFWQLLCHLSLIGMCRKKTKRRFFCPKTEKPCWEISAKERADTDLWKFGANKYLVRV